MFFAERIDEVGDEIFVFGAIFEDFFFVSYDDFLVGDFDDFFAGDGKFWVEEGFDSGAFDDDLLNYEVIIGESVRKDFAKFGAFFGFDFEADRVKPESKNFADFDYVVFAYEVFVAINNEADIGVFANRFDI